MRVVLDTNVLIDGSKDTFSAEYKLLAAIREGNLTMLVTPAVFREYYRLLPQRLPDAAYLSEIDEVLDKAEEVIPTLVETQIDDPEDYKFLQAAAGGRADMLVTSDKHLLVAGEVGNIPIMTPTEAWIRVREDMDGSSEWTDWSKNLFGVCVLFLVLLIPGVIKADEESLPVSTDQSSDQSNQSVDQALSEMDKNQAEIKSKQSEIADLDKKINDLRGKRDTTKAEAQVIAGQLARLEKRLEEAQLELKQTQLNIRVVQKQQSTNMDQIKALEADRDDTRSQLKETVRSLYQYEQMPVIQIFFNHDSLSSFLADRAAYKTLQDRYVILAEQLRAKEEKLNAHQQQLTIQENDLSQLNTLLSNQQQELNSQQAEQTQFLKSKRQEQIAYDAKLAEAQQARKEIEQHIFTLKNSGIKLTLTQATDMAKYASKLTGVRAAVLLGVLKVETNLGTNIGSGVFPDDMQPQSRDAFLRICAKLGLDPHKAPISARPRSYQGWGGAMGPGQMMPSSWETIESRVGQLMGKANPNPYELTDAFVATAIFLADRGATSLSGEYEAVNRYLAGPNWQRFTWYGDRVLAVAQEYAKEGL